MAIGYFIGLNDKTSCGGKVLDGDTRVMMYGVAHAHEGDRVTCGKDGKTYRIQGGVPHIISYGRHVAGTLDSFSNCPCRAGLIPSVRTATYRKKANPAPQAARATPQPPTPPDSWVTQNPQEATSPAYTTAPPTLAPAGAVCDERFQLLNHRGLPFRPLDYALLQNDQCIAYGRLDNRGHNQPHGSATPVSLQIAISAPSPDME
ncbi:hypothetical protein D3C76_632890 [compost metagenome]